MEPYLMQGDKYNKVYKCNTDDETVKLKFPLSLQGQLCLFLWVLSLLGKYYYNIYIHVVKMFEIVFFFMVKDNKIFPCLHNIRLSYNIFFNQNVHVYIKQ